MKTLDTASPMLVGDRAGQIAQSLYDSTIRGSAPSARLLLDLAQENIEAVNALKMEPLRSWAEKLASESEWPDELSAETAETGVGSREPEAA